MDYIGIDIGTSCCKAAVVDDSGKISAYAKGSYKLIQKHEGWVELDPNEVWSAVKKCLTALAPNSSRVSGIAISSIGESLVMLDYNDRPLSNCITYLDRRCVTTWSDSLEKINPKRFYELTGRVVSPIQTLFKIRWLKSHEPNLLKKTKKIFMLADYVAYELSGERAIDAGTASTTLLLDVNRCDWSGEIANEYDIPIDRFSPVYLPGTLLGKIRWKLADELRLSHDINIFLGCHDQSSATLGGGALSEGDIVSGQGSAESYNMILDSQLDAYKKIGLTYQPYVLANQYFATLGQLSHGTALRWFSEQIEKDFYEKCQDNAVNVLTALNDSCPEDCGNVYFFPHLADGMLGENGDRNGACGVFIGLDTRTDKAMMYRALLEGLAFESRKNYQLLSTLGIVMHPIYMVGGCTNSNLLMQMKADVLRQKINILESADSGIVGLGMICAVARGDCKSYVEARKSFVRSRKTYYPIRCYESKYKKYISAENLINQIEL